MEEALLLGRPVIQLVNTDYLEFINIEGVQGAIRKGYSELCPDDFINISNILVDHEKMRECLGLEQPLINHKRLFAEEIIPLKLSVPGASSAKVVCKIRK